MNFSGPCSNSSRTRAPMKWSEIIGEIKISGLTSKRAGAGCFTMVFLQGANCRRERSFRALVQLRRIATDQAAGRPQLTGESLRDRAAHNVERALERATYLGNRAALIARFGLEGELRERLLLRLGVADSFLKGAIHDRKVLGAGCWVLVPT